MRWVLLAGVIFSALFSGYVFYLDYTIRTQFEGKRWAIPAKVFARPLELYPGAQLSADQFENELLVLSYNKSNIPTRPGSYWRNGNNFHVVTRDFIFWDSPEQSVPLRVEFRGREVRTVDHAKTGDTMPLVRFDPAIIGRIYPSHTEDRVLVQLEEVPALLTKALMLVEDRNFYTHGGVSVRSIFRAMLANLRAGGTVQGGSTLTQQLVKNFFLSNERTITRKVNEAIMALLLEHHYAKDEILEAYLNEIYLGQDGRRAIHGFGLASRFYFDKPITNLDVEELALLVAMVKGASYYNPRRFVKRAMDRRNLVIDLLEQEGEISKHDALTAKAKGLGVTSRAQSGVTSYPAFMDLVRRQLKRDYREEDLNSEGLQIFTTFDPLIQTESEKAFTRRLNQLGKSRDTEEAELQAASVVISVESGEVLSMVGGRNPRFAGFNRVLDAVRPIGSLVKPSVYLTALSRPEQYTLATLLDDSPFTLELETGDQWVPENFDKESHGMVPLVLALANSYNLSSARLGMELGLPNIIETLKRLGVEREIKPYPSLLLGALALSPWEIAQVYHTLATGGFRTPLRAIREVLTAKGEPLQRYPLSIQQVYDSTPIYLVSYAMRIAARYGTGRGMYRTLPEDLVVASKTGTSNDLRDSWFAGFTGDKLGIVWVGKDNNEPTGLTGSSGALRIWVDIFNQISLVQGIEAPPPNIEMVKIDTATGLRGGFGCEETLELPFIVGTAPSETSPCTERGGGKGFRWLRELF
ncbi:MAG: penicillin-binding protein 1B [Gammaproteobacteria bacterium SG8_15]|nr:MAG: penicillin-binding protein 1B [Gammaproteobacteria bacterium SG8_15]